MQITLAAQTLEELTIMSLTATHHRCQNENLPSGIVVHDHVDDLLLGVFHHRFARHVAVCLAGTGKEQSQVVVNLGRGTHGGTRILVGSLLFDADDGRQSGNLIHVGTLHASQEVAGVGRERLNIAALSLGKDGVEGQAGLAAAAQSGDDRQRVSGNGDVDVLQIVDTRSPDVDHLLIFHCHSLTR